MLKKGLYILEVLNIPHFSQFRHMMVHKWDSKISYPTATHIAKIVFRMHPRPFYLISVHFNNFICLPISVILFKLGFVAHCEVIIPLFIQGKVR